MSKSVLITFCFCLIFPLGAAGLVSARHTHPIDWMYQLPVGEAPGWTSRVWADLQFSESNVWNFPMRVQDRKSGRIYEYEMDYQASVAVLDLGFALGESWAFSVELPYMRRHPGNTDEFIEDWHQVFGFYNYLRGEFPRNRVRMRVAVDGQETLVESESADGLSSVKLKLKYRLFKWGQSVPGGLAVSSQVNLPVNSDRRALSAGSQTVSFLAHIGIPVGRESGIYLTTGWSSLGENRFFKDWAMNRVVAMGDLTLDIGISNGWGVFASFLGYSPWMKSRYEFLSESESAGRRKQERISSGYNSLFRWRGYQNYGLRYRWGKAANQFSVFIFEDFGFGDYDSRREVTYNNNAPDVLIGTQFSLRF